MGKNDSLHTLFKTLKDILPYEYHEKLIAKENTIVLTKEGSDYTMYVSLDELDNDDSVVTVSCEDLIRSYNEEYEAICYITENEQIPIDTIITYIKHYLS